MSCWRTDSMSKENVQFQNISIPPPRKGFFLRPPQRSGNSNKASYMYISLNFWVLQNPHPQKVSIPSVGGVWIFSGCAQIYILMIKVTKLSTQGCLKPGSHMLPTYLGYSCRYGLNIYRQHNVSQAFTTDLPAKLSWVQLCRQAGD